MDFNYLEDLFGENPAEYSAFLDNICKEFLSRKEAVGCALTNRDEKAISDLRHICRAILLPLKAEQFQQLFEEQRRLSEMNDRQIQENIQKITTAFDNFLAAVREKQKSIS